MIWKVNSQNAFRRLGGGWKNQQVIILMLGFISFTYFFSDKDVAKELVKVQELIKANIQRSKVIQDQVMIKSLKNDVTV